MAEQGATFTTLKDLQTRFLYPFAFERRRVPDAVAALQAVKAAPGDDQPEYLWQCAEPHHLYRDELLDHVIHFLFPGSGAAGSDGDAAECAYLKIADAPASAWFAHTEVAVGTARLSVRLVPGIRIELFLSSQGVGLLSLALTPGSKALPLDQALDFNYQLAQFRHRPAARLRRRHPQDDPETWKKIPDHQRDGIKPPPGDDAPLEQRLGKPGGSFTLKELIDYLLSPLKAEKCRYQPIQSELAVYTVARLDQWADFADAAVRSRLAPFLSSLAQVEEPTHTGMPPDTLGVANTILNRRHWAAVGLLGAAHLIGDQGSVAFDDQKLTVVRDKYFIPFEVAFLQRIALNLGIEEAAAELARGDEAALTDLRDDLLRFAVAGHFTQVSSRHALHRFYQLAREGLDIPSAWEEVRRAIADLDARITGNRQSHMTQGIDRNLRVVAHVQTIAEWIEIFIVSVYCAHLWHMFAHDNTALQELLGFKQAGDEHSGPWSWVVHGGVVAAAALSGLITALIVRPWKGADDAHQGPRRLPPAAQA